MRRSTRACTHTRTGAAWLAHDQGDVADAIPNTLRGKDIAVVDVEGNGQTPPEIIEIAILSVSGETVDIDDMRVWLIKPQRPITEIVTRKVHGIKNSDVETCPAWAEIAPDIEAALAGRTLVAHNAGVEQRVLATHLRDRSPPMVLDTLRLAKAVWRDLWIGLGCRCSGAEGVRSHLTPCRYPSFLQRNPIDDRCATPARPDPWNRVGAMLFWNDGPGGGSRIVFELRRP
ncbi:3'-5' exonuclease [Nocardia sp. NPDC046473]|uniref:3'-5' exonuclease n=1 Tax=Nocardia sp. NPDC046473 TaxID=3155733 RepID=UPI0033F0AA4A